MRILALETTALSASVAAFDTGQMIANRPCAEGQRSAQSLAPAIQDLLQQVGWQPNQVDLVALPIGPGSFTGLRVGVATAKTFAYAVGAEVIGLDTMQVIAAQVPASLTAVSVVLDAQRQQLFAASFQRDANGTMICNLPTQIVDADKWLADLPPNTTLNGPVLEKIGDRLPPHVRAVEKHWWAPQAATVGQLAHDQYVAGRRDDLWRLAPKYYRKSAAEERRDAAGT